MKEGDARKPKTPERDIAESAADEEAGRDKRRGEREREEDVCVLSRRDTVSATLEGGASGRGRGSAAETGLDF